MANDEPLTEAELAELHEWCDLIGIGSDGHYLEVRPVARLLAEVERLRAAETAMREIVRAVALSEYRITAETLNSKQHALYLDDDLRIAARALVRQWQAKSEEGEH